MSIAFEECVDEEDWIIIDLKTCENRSLKRNQLQKLDLSLNVDSFADTTRGVYFHFIPNGVQKNLGCNKLFQSKNYNLFQSNIACLIFLKTDLNKYRVMYIGLVLN